MLQQDRVGWSFLRYTNRVSLVKKRQTREASLPLNALVRRRFECDSPQYLVSVPPFQTLIQFSPYVRYSRRP